MLGRSTIVSLLIFVTGAVTGQSLLNFGSYHRKKLSAGFQSNRIVLLQFDTSKWNIQFQQSIINEKLQFQQFNFALRYNLKFNNTSLVLGGALQNSLSFKNPGASVYLESEHEIGVFAMAGLLGYNFYAGRPFSRLGANANFFSIYYVQVSYGRSDFELFGDERTAEVSLICKTSAISLKLASQIPVENNKLQAQYNRFITTFFITILK